MMTDYGEQLKRALEATVVYSPTAYSCFGKEPPKIPLRIRRAMPDGALRKHALQHLQSYLYTEFYTRGGASSTPLAESSSLTGAAAFVDALAAANTGNGCWEDGWRAESVTPGEVVAVKSGLRLWARPEECAAPDGASLERDTPLRLCFPKELFGMSPGYYMALSDRGESDDFQPIVRMYWNLRAEGAGILVRAATRLMNEAGLFFRLKALNDPSAYVRCDAVVVYVYRRDYLAASACMAQAYAAVAPYLKSGTPAFTKLLARGLGLAEDPGPGESFGENRCRILAEAFIHAYEQGARTVDERLEIVSSCYSAAGVSLTQPYLNPDSCDDYEFPILQ